jgi:heme/copper-type cytochrome/quinol oxidase subunit 2
MSRLLPSGLLLSGALCAMVLAASPAAHAEDPPVFSLVLKDHKFEPAELRVPADTRFQIKVRNADPTVAEIESLELKVERVITGGRETTLRLGPLAAGRYPFMDEFNSETAQGMLIVEAK